MAKSESVEPRAPLTLRRLSTYSFQGILYLQPDFRNLSPDSVMVGHELGVAAHGGRSAVIIGLYALHQRFHGTARAKLVQEGCYGAKKALSHSHPMIHALTDPDCAVPTISEDFLSVCEAPGD